MSDAARSIAAPNAWRGRARCRVSNARSVNQRGNAGWVPVYPLVASKRRMRKAARSTGRYGSRRDPQKALACAAITFELSPPSAESEQGAFTPSCARDCSLGPRRQIGSVTPDARQQARSVRRIGDRRRSPTGSSRGATIEKSLMHQSPSHLSAAIKERSVALTNSLSLLPPMLAGTRFLRKWR